MFELESFESFSTTTTSVALGLLQQPSAREFTMITDLLIDLSFGMGDTPPKRQLNGIGRLTVVGRIKRAAVQD